MTVQRRLLFYVCILLFCGVGAYLIFIAQGYRYSVQKGVVERTGEITVDTRPRGAVVTLDGAPPLTLFDRLTGKTTVVTPSRIRSLLSGEYHVTLSRDGYFPITIPVMILPGRAAILTNVILLKKPALDLERTDGDIVQFVADSSRIVYRTSDHRIYAYDRRAKEAQKLFAANEPIESLIPSPSGRKIAIIGKTKLWIVSSGGREISRPLSRAGVSKMVWSQSDALFGLTERGMAAFDERASTFVSILSGRFSDLSAAVSLAVLDAQGTLSVFDIRKPLKPVVIGSLRTDAEGISGSENGFIELRNTIRNALDLVSESRPAGGRLRVPHSQSIRWIDRTSFVAWDDFELSSGSVADGQLSLAFVTRQSQPITEVFAHQASSAIFFRTANGTLYAQDRLTRDPKNLAVLFDLSNGSLGQLAVVGEELIGSVSRDGNSGFISFPLAE